MQTADSTTTSTILSHFPERIQAALRAYGAEINLPPEAVVQLAIGYFLESADIAPGLSNQDSPNGTASPDANSEILTHLSSPMQKGIGQYATEYEFPPEFVIELAVTFLLDPEASSFEDCQVGVQREQVYLLQQYSKHHQAEAA